MEQMILLYNIEFGVAPVAQATAVQARRRIQIAGNRKSSGPPPMPDKAGLGTVATPRRDIAR
jgi:hypothetical protein